MWDKMFYPYIWSPLSLGSCWSSRSCITRLTICSSRTRLPSYTSLSLLACITWFTSCSLGTSSQQLVSVHPLSRIFKIDIGKTNLRSNSSLSSTRSLPTMCSFWAFQTRRSWGTCWSSVSNSTVGTRMTFLTLSAKWTLSILYMHVIHKQYNILLCTHFM